MGGQADKGGLDYWKGGIGIAGGVLNAFNSNDELEAQNAQIKVALDQNQSSYYQKTEANNKKLTDVLAGNRALAAGEGITMDSGSFSEAMERNVSAFDEDNLSDAINASFTKEKLLAQENANNQENYANKVGGFLKAGEEILPAVAAAGLL